MRRVRIRSCLDEVVPDSKQMTFENLFYGVALTNLAIHSGLIQQMKYELGL